MRVYSDIQGAYEANAKKTYFTDDNVVGNGISKVLITKNASELQKLGEPTSLTISIDKIKEQLEAGMYSVNGKLVAKSIINLFD